jgi:hypothetical protein
MITARVLRVASCMFAAALGVWWMASPALAIAGHCPTPTTIDPRSPRFSLLSLGWR